MTPPLSLVLALVVLAPALAASATTASPGSLGITPAELRVDEAQRGEVYVRHVELQNEFDTETLVVLERDGVTGGWVRLDAAEVRLPPRTHVSVPVLVEVPSDAENGLYSGAVRFVAEAKGTPAGSGMSVRQAVAVPLGVEVGGEQVVSLRWGAVDARDVEDGTRPEVSVEVVNDGNVRTTARALARVLAPASEAVLAKGGAEGPVAPGERATLTFVFDAPLPQGQYRVVVTPEGGGAPAADEFKVVAPGALGKEGSLRFLEHEPRAEPGMPVRIAAVFVNEGGVTIARAKFVAEAYVGDRLVAVLESDERLVPPGETVRLVAFYTPKEAGEHRIVGRVIYDGYEAPPNEGLLTVSGRQDAAAERNWLLPAGLVAVIAVAVGIALMRRRR